MYKRFRLAGGLLILVALPAAPLFAAVIIGGAGAPVMVMDDCCKVMLVPAPVVALPAGGAVAGAVRAQVLADFPAIPAAQVGLGAAAPGTLNIDVYAAVLYGCDIEVRYNDGVAGPSWTFPPPFPGGAAPSYRFIQKITTNMPLGGPGGMYIDPRPNDDPGGMPLPFYETDREAARFSNGANGFGAYDLWFWDKPRRPCKNTHTTWQGELFLASENLFVVPGAPGYMITIHDGFRYGFEIWPKKLFARILTLTDTVLNGMPTIATWSEATWTNNLMNTTTVGVTYPGGITTPPGPPPAPFVVTVPDTWPPSNIAPDAVQYAVNFQNPMNGVPSQTLYMLSNLHDMANQGDNWAIQVPLLMSQETPALEVRVDLSKNLITVIDRSQPPSTNRQNNYNAVIGVDMFTTFNPGQFNLQVGGMRILQFALTAIEHPRGDLNGDGAANGKDIKLFVDLCLMPPLDQDPNLVPFGDFDMSASVTPADVPDFALALLGLLP